MKILSPVASNDILSRWASGGFDDARFRDEVLRTLPSDAIWSTAELEAEDISRLFCLSRPEWVDLTQSTFRFSRALQNLETPSANPHTLRIQDDVGRMLRWIREFDARGLRLFAVTDTLETAAPITIIDGMSGALALARLNRLAGTPIFLAVTPQARSWRWSRDSFRAQSSIPRPAGALRQFRAQTTRARAVP